VNRDSEAGTAPPPSEAPQREPGVRRRRRIALAALLAGGAGALAAFALRGAAREAPAVSFTTLEGERIALADLRGRVVLVNFWATSCAICVAEMPALAGLHRRLAPRGLATIAVAMPYDRPDFVLHYAQRSALPFPVALDPSGTITQAFGPVRGTPTLVVVDRGGRIVHTLEGESGLAGLAAVVERTLAAA
jgi:peroxiredoxin